MDQTELPKKTNAWQEHLKTIKEKYPDLSLSERLKIGKDTYVKVEKPKPEKLKKVKSDNDTVIFKAKKKTKPKNLDVLL